MPAEGKIIRIIGPVVDVEFAVGELPAIYNAVRVERDDVPDLILEVAQHLGDNVVRCVAMAHRYRRPHHGAGGRCDPGPHHERGGRAH